MKKRIARKVLCGGRGGQYRTVTFRRALVRLNQTTEAYSYRFRRMEQATADMQEIMDGLKSVMNIIGGVLPVTESEAAS